VAIRHIQVINPIRYKNFFILVSLLPSKLQIYKILHGRVQKKQKKMSLPVTNFLMIGWEVIIPNMGIKSSQHGNKKFPTWE
jgi:hypothetical protein